MRILVDENFNGSFVRWLRENGHDVVWVMELLSGIGDEEVLAIAEREQCVLLTLDRDHDELIFRHGAACRGVVLVRLDKVPYAERLSAFRSAWSMILDRIEGHFIVVTASRFRVRPLPPSRF